MEDAHGRIGVGGVGGHHRGGLQFDQFVVHHRRRRGARDPPVPAPADPFPRAPSATTPASPPPPSGSGTSPPWPSAASSRGRWSVPRPTSTCQLDGRGQRPQDRGGQCRRPVLGHRQPAGHPERHQHRRRPGRGVLHLRQLRRGRAGPEPGRPRRDRGPQICPPTSCPTSTARSLSRAGGRRGCSSTSRTSSGTSTTDKVGTVIADLPSTLADWAGEKYVMEKVGYKIIYDQQYADTQTDFTQNVIAMKNAGVKVHLPRPDAGVVRLGPVEGPGSAELPPQGGARCRHLLERADPGLGGRGRRQRLLPRPERLALPRGGRVHHPGRRHLPPLGERGLARLGRPTCSPCTHGTRPRSSSRPSRTPDPTPAGARSSRPCPRSPRSTATTS